MKLPISLITATAVLLFIFIGFLHSNLKISISTPLTSIIQKNSDPTSPSASLKPSNTTVVTDGIEMLYPTKKNGRAWYARWSGRNAITLKSGKSDPPDLEFFARGNGTVYIDGKGIAHLQGSSPRMYILDPAKNKKWDNVEVTVYAKRISESGVVSSQGIVIGARSEHQDATKENPCFGQTYYGRLLYDGRAVFQKEVIHEGAYSINKPGENNKTDWGTPDGTLPRNVWIGVKFVIKTNPDIKSVKLELYRDLTDVKDGGTWEKVAEYNDNGDWSQTDSGADVMAICGYPASKILLDPAASVFIRNDEIKDAEYKLFSIREID